MATGAQPSPFPELVMVVHSVSSIPSFICAGVAISLYWPTGRRIVTLNQMGLLALAPPVVMIALILSMAIGRPSSFDFTGVAHGINTAICIPLGLLYSYRAIQAPHSSPHLSGLACGTLYALALAFLFSMGQYSFFWRYQFYRDMEYYTSIITGLVFILTMLAWGLIVWRFWNNNDLALHLSRIKQNICIACCYDLHGLPPGATCPECGQAQQADHSTPSAPG